MKSIVCNILAILALCNAAAGQSPTSNGPVKVARVQPERQQMTFKYRVRFDVGDLAMLGGAAFDVAASLGKREAGVTGHGHQFNAGANIAVKGGTYALIKTAEYFYPGHPRLMMFVKIGFGVGWGVAGLISAQRQKRR
jgi:hypothetical protein